MSTEDLQKMTLETRDALRTAADWLRDPANQDKIGSRQKKLEQQVRKATVGVEKLVNANNRQMCVAVFGPSQVGKSHLVSVLAAPQGRELMAVFNGHDDTSYIRKINPDKGKEATGLVTRFTMQETVSPTGYPVCLRLLTHADIIKIICNAYFRDGNPVRFEGDQLAQHKEIADHIEKYRALMTGNYNNGLKVEDIWDLQDYFRNSLGDFHLYKIIDPSFWDCATDIVSKIAPNELVGFFEILWNRHPAISALYLTLFHALSQLNFSDDAFCQLDAITQDVRIIDVDALNALTDPQSAAVMIVGKNGIPVSMTRAILAALTAELKIFMREKAWPFQSHTDILDFPGYRARGLSGLEEEHNGLNGLAGMLSHNQAGTLKDLFLRGKVDYLFQRYVADQEITAMMLCIKESNMEVVSLPDVVNDWIARSHGGPKPTDRSKNPTLLFFILTRFDLMLREKANDSDSNPADNFEGRMQASLIEKFAKGHSWPVEWTPSQPFKNVYLMRSPGAKSELFNFENGQEVGLKSEEVGRVARLRAAFEAAPLVSRHFTSPGRAFDEMLKAGDGGTSYIVENLTTVCLADTKPKQIKSRLRKIAIEIYEDLNRFYVSTDIDQRLKESEEAAQRAIDAVEHLLALRRFGSFLNSLMVEAGPLTDHLQQSIVRSSRSDATSPAMGRVLPRPGGVLPRPGGLPRPGTQIAEPSEGIAQLVSSVSPRDLELAKSAVEFWMGSMQQVMQSESLLQYFGVSDDVMRIFILEIAAAASRVELALLIAKELGEMSHVELFEQHIAKASVLAQHRINRFVSEAGFSYTAVEQRPVSAQPDRRVFAPKPNMNSIEPLPETSPNNAEAFTIDWIYAFYEMVRLNVMSERGQTFDIEQNKKLGAILQVLEASAQ